MNAQPCFPSIPLVTANISSSLRKLPKETTATIEFEFEWGEQGLAPAFFWGLANDFCCIVLKFLNLCAQFVDALLQGDDLFASLNL